MRTHSCHGFLRDRRHEDVHDICSSIRCCTRSSGTNVNHVNDPFTNLWNKQFHNLLGGPLLHSVQVWPSKPALGGHAQGGFRHVLSGGKRWWVQRAASVRASTLSARCSVMSLGSSRSRGARLVEQRCHSSTVVEVNWPTGCPGGWEGRKAEVLFGRLDLFGTIFKCKFSLLIVVYLFSNCFCVTQFYIFTIEIFLRSFLTCEFLMILFWSFSFSGQLQTKNCAPLEVSHLLILKKYVLLKMFLCLVKKAKQPGLIKHTPFFF